MVTMGRKENETEQNGNAAFLKETTFPTQKKKSDIFIVFSIHTGRVAQHVIDEFLFSGRLYARFDFIF